MSTDELGSGKRAAPVDRPPLSAVLVVLGWAAVVYGCYLVGYLR